MIAASTIGSAQTNDEPSEMICMTKSSTKVHMHTQHPDSTSTERDTGARECNRML